VLLEAMASGLTVVAADTGPTREVLAGGGLTFPVGDDGALAAALLALDADPAHRRAVAASGLAVAHRRTWSRVFDELVADYLVVHAGARVPTLGPRRAPVPRAEGRESRARNRTVSSR
jgi:glycosyltransferase involved in cell wall biosynthesis